MSAFTCTEFSEACEYKEHAKCAGDFICPEQGITESCACNCHLIGNEHMRNGRTPQGSCVEDANT